MTIHFDTDQSNIKIKVLYYEISVLHSLNAIKLYSKILITSEIEDTSSYCILHLVIL